MFKGLLAFFGSWADCYLGDLGALGVLSLMSGATLPNRASMRLRVGVIGLIGLALVCLWIAALAVSATNWLLWATLAFTILYFMAAGRLAKARRLSKRTRGRTKESRVRSDPPAVCIFSASKR